MFYATDFLEHTHVGTGTVVDRMVDAYTLEGRPRPVTRARFDWQVYDPARKEKGGVRWHTVEGPFVLRRKGRYYEMFSGGNWQNLSYGVSYATSDRVLADDEWHQTCDGTSVLPILRTIPDRVVGPGHNSVVLGPDGRQLYCVYHRWTAAGRALAIDRLEWVGDRLTVLGPTDEPTPAPILPGVRPTNLGAWTPARGAWSLRDDLLAQDATDTVAEATLDVGSSAFAVEASVRWQPMSPLQGSVGVELLAGDAVVLVFSIARSERAVSLRWGPAELVERTTLPADFEFEAFHELRLDVDGSRVRALLDGGAARWSVDVGIAATRVALLTAGAAAEVAGVSVSRGWSDDFEGDGAAEGAGWRVVSGRWRVDGLELRATAPGRVAKRVPSADYELVVNARSNDVEIAPALGPDGKGPVFSILRDGGEWSLAGGGGTFPLGADFDASQVWQLRFRKRGGRLDVALEGRWLGGVDAPSDAASVELGARSAGAAFEHARASELPGGSSRETL
jgi:hypothetical protein